MSNYVRSILNKEIRPTLGMSWTEWLGGTMLALGFVIFEADRFQTTFRGSFTHFVGDLDLVGQIILAVYAIAALILLVLFFLSASVASLSVRIFCVALFAFALTIEYSYQNALGRFTNYYDIIAAMSATGEQKADSISSFVSFAPAIPVAILSFFAFVLPARETRFGWKMFGCILLATTLFYVHLSYVKAGLLGGDLPNTSLGIFCESLSDFAVQNPMEQLAPIKRTEVRAPVNAIKPNNNIVLIFDESIRADHLSLNGYSRQTTPFLSQLEKEGLLINWGIAAAAATSSHPSYDAFITGVQPDQLEKMSLRELNSLPTIFQYAKTMGYRTTLFDGQMMKYWGGAADDLNYIDEFDSLAVIDRPDRLEDWQSASNKITDESQRKVGLKQWQIDEHIAVMINKIFTGSTGNFIFVYKRGCHFPYEKNFPPEETIWKPIYHFQEQYEIPPADKVDAILNSYDDSLKYNLDEFFKKLAVDYTALPNNTVIIYTGDHGESFYANGRAGHGGDTVEEASVPLFVLGLNDPKIDTNFKASHHNMFAAMLDLMNYPQELLSYQYSVSILKAKPSDSRPRFFNPSPNKKIRFDP